ncbi:MAG TPA: hypothetical protein VIL42_01310 [Sphingomicrobium sp.]|jgi:hypothetical protein
MADLARTPARFEAEPLRIGVATLLDRQGVWFAAIACLALLQAALIFTHEPWLDEWQALQMALQSPTLPDLLANLRYEGHPPLWYLILRAIGSLVPPAWVLAAALAPIALVTSGVILFASPFSRWQKLCLVTGELILFEYLTISRSLSLGVCLVLVAFAARRSRWAWLAIALLPMCDFLFGVLSLALVVIMWRERRLYLPGVALWIASGLLAALSVAPPSDAAPALGPGSPLAETYHWITRLGLLLLPFPVGANNVPQWSADVPFGLGILLGPLFLLFAFNQLREDRLHMLLFAGFLAVTLVFTSAVYPLHVRHLSLAALLLILLKWRDVERGSRANAAFDIWLVVGAACGLAVAAINLSQPFDTAAFAARDIHRLGLQEKHWLAYPGSRASGVSALTGIEFEPVGRGCRQSFVRWDRQTGVDPAQLETFFRQAIARYGRFYLLTDRPLAMPSDLMRLLSFVPGGYEGQEYHLYVVGPALAERAVTVPPCRPANRLPLIVDPAFAAPSDG